MKRTLFALTVSAAGLVAPAIFAQTPPEPGVTPASTTTEAPGTIDRMGAATSNAVRQTGEGLADAALSPLEDLNLRRDEIPPLLASFTSPYEMPHLYGCVEITALISDLDSVLGPDWDAPKAEKKKWDERAADGAASAALDTVSSEASGLIPLRGVVRKLTRAEQHAKAYNRAFALGAQRRAFLKGLGAAQGCTGTAAPRPIEEDDGKIVYRTPQNDYQPVVRRRVVKKP